MAKGNRKKNKQPEVTKAPEPVQASVVAEPEELVVPNIQTILKKPISGDDLAEQQPKTTSLQTESIIPEEKTPDPVFPGISSTGITFDELSHLGDGIITLFPNFIKNYNKLNENTRRIQLKSFIEKIKNIDEISVSEDLNALQFAAQVGNIEVVKLLIEGGAQIDYNKNSFGKTALMIAYKSGQMEIFEYLLPQSSLLKTDIQNKTIIHHINDNFTIKHEDKFYNLMINICMSAKDEALHIIKREPYIFKDFIVQGFQQNVEFIKNLVELENIEDEKSVVSNFHRALPLLTDKTGTNLLQIAARDGDLKLFQQFCKFQFIGIANFISYNNAGKNVIHLASENGHHHIISFIIKRVKDDNQNTHISDIKKLINFPDRANDIPTTLVARIINKELDINERRELNSKFGETLMLLVSHGGHRHGFENGDSKIPQSVKLVAAVNLSRQHGFRAEAYSASATIHYLSNLPLKETITTICSNVNSTIQSWSQGK